MGSLFLLYRKVSLKPRKELNYFQFFCSENDQRKVEIRKVYDRSSGKSILSCQLTERYFDPPVITRYSKLFTSNSLIFIYYLLLLTRSFLRYLSFVNTCSIIITFYSLFLFINYCNLLLKLWKISDIKNLHIS